MPRIRECGRTVGGDVVAFHMAWDGELDGRAQTWSVVITSEAGDDAVVLAHAREDGRFAGQYVLGQRSGERDEVPENADVDAEEMTARFPADVVGVAVEWPVWKAELSIDGSVVSSQVIPTG